MKTSVIYQKFEALDGKLKKEPTNILESKTYSNDITNYL